MEEDATTYVDVMKAAGPPGASSNGFNENLALFNSGKCAMWIDATVAASFVTNPKDSQVADKVGFRAGAECGAGKERQLAVGVESRHSRRLEEGSPLRKNSSHGQPARTTPSSSLRKKDGRTFRPVHGLRSIRILNI
jgi:ABC-type sugar transport system, periplasmic component